MAAEDERNLVPADPALEFASEVLRLINIERQAQNLPDLTGMEKLKAAADIRAEEIAILFSHKRPGEESYGSIFAECELDYSYVGENIAYGYSNPSDLVQAWMDSFSHKNVIMGKDYTNAELGYYQDSDGRIYCAMLFFTPAAA